MLSIVTIVKRDSRMIYLSIQIIAIYKLTQKF